MADTKVYYREIRFIIEDELIQCYILIEAFIDPPINLNGWHHKTFPSSMGYIQIFEFFNEEPPILWVNKAP